MNFSTQFKKQIFNLTKKNFETACLELFNYQFHHCEVYHNFCLSLKKTPKKILSIDQIPFMPIEFFKKHIVKSGIWNTKQLFESSGTTQSQQKSHHHIADLEFYHRISLSIFENVFGSLNQLKIVALLPSYLEQKNSSLISMVNNFIKKGKKGSNYYSVDDIESALKYDNDDIILIGVSYALLDFIKKINSPTHAIIIETGGMKGRRKEMIRKELHQYLKKGFKQSYICSEYGMTELFSQAYGKNGIFTFPNWAKVIIRDINDPFCYIEGHIGGINIIDLANVDTCAFIETQDLGRSFGYQFEVLGRIDNSDIRGCSLLSY